MQQCNSAVFLMNGLICCLIAAVLGTGLNALVSAQDAEDEQCFVGDISVDPRPAVALAGKSAVMRCFRGLSKTLSREFQFVDGKMHRKSEWNELGQRADTVFYVNGAAKTRARQVVFDGAQAWDREEYWDTGLMRLRGTYLQGDGAQGLVQTYFEAGPLASEVWYEKGKVVRRKRFGLDGRQIADEEFMANGQIKSQMHRF